ncbi:hypothetical protein SEVIR_2G328366v4 [Setaria viridis]|uniref:Uncharacterized protein n=1 Tax=Setaria viridis TaxID=4556 RepID=A0A4U6W2L1_SETVI|nr:uncharacterized protein LOC117845801 [Setaria viridis]TKW34779.1 hypothetical protein SEVIR_2G328366v2 [Setaria viridis]
MIGLASDPSAAVETDGRGRSSVNTADATLGDLPQAAAEEEAAGADDEAAAEAMGFRLSWTSSHPLAAALEETTPIGPKRFTYGPVPFRDKSFDTVQVFSVAIKEIKPELGFHWPLQVYGLVAHGTIRT